MPGALIHIISGAVLVGLIYLRGYSREYMEVGFIGSLFPDIFKYLIVGIYYENLNFFYVINTEIWKNMTELSLWGFSLLVIISLFFIGLFLYESHVIKKKAFWRYEKIEIMFLAGILLHLVLDFLWIENSWLV